MEAGRFLELALCRWVERHWVMSGQNTWEREGHRKEVATLVSLRATGSLWSTSTPPRWEEAIVLHRLHFHGRSILDWRHGWGHHTWVLWAPRQWSTRSQTPQAVWPSRRTLGCPMWLNRPALMRRSRTGLVASPRIESAALVQHQAPVLVLLWLWGLWTVLVLVNPSDWRRGQTGETPQRFRWQHQMWVDTVEWSSSLCTWNHRNARLVEKAVRVHWRIWNFRIPLELRNLCSQPHRHHGHFTWHHRLLQLWW